MNLMDDKRKNLLLRLTRFWTDNREKRLFRVGVYTVTVFLTYYIAFSVFRKDNLTFTLSFDGRDQNYPWLAYVGEWMRQVFDHILHGNFNIPLFDMSIGWGDGTISYLSSNGMLDPFLALASAFLPNSATEGLYNFLPAVCIYLSGLSFLYLCDYFKKDFCPSLIGSLIYVFNAFTVYYVLAFNMSANFMVFLPLLIVGVEKILRRERAVSFIFSVFFSIICGSYYRLYILTILMGIYALIRFFTMYEKKEWGRMLPGVLAKGIGYYLLGFGLSAAFIFPALAVFFSSTRTSSTRFIVSSDLAVHWKYFWARFLSLIAPASEYSWDWGLDYPAYAALVFPAAIVLFSQAGRKTLKWLTAMGLLMLFCPVFGWIMNGFQYVCNRWSFALALLAGFLVAEVLPELFRMNKKQWIACFVSLFAYTVIAFLFSDMRTMVIAVLGVAFLALTLLFLSQVGKSALHTKARTGLCLLLVMLNVGVNSIYMASPSYMNWGSWFLPVGEPTLSVAASAEGDAYQFPDGDSDYDGRFDSSKFHYNDSLFYGIPGTSFYSSTINNNVSDFRKELEMCGNVQDFKSYSTDQRTMVNTLLSVKYQIEDPNSDYVPYGYKSLIGTMFGRFVYENQYALPWGYTYDRSIAYEELEGRNGVEKAEILMQAAAVDKGHATSDLRDFQSESERVDYEALPYDCTWEDGSLITSSVNAQIALVADLPAGKEYYVKLKGFNVDGYESDVLSITLSASFNFYVSSGGVVKYGRAMSPNYPWYYGREDYLFCLGCSEVDRNRVDVMIPAVGEFKLEDIELFALPLDSYPENAEKLRREPLEHIKIANSKITGTVDLSEDKLLCLTVPYDNGWTAYVDGKEQEVLRVNYAFLGLELPEGHHEIEFRYFTPGLKEGLWVSLGSFLAILLVVLVTKPRKKHAPEPNEKKE